MFIVEDGTGITGANALISVAEFDTFLTDRGIESLTWTAVQKQAAIVTSSVDYIDSFFCFKGTSLKDTQGMQLPTDKVTINDRIKLACSQAALLHLKGRLFVDPTELNTSGQVVLERDKLDVLETEKEYKEGSNYTTKYPTTQTDRLLQPYVIGGGLGRAYRW